MSASPSSSARSTAAHEARLVARLAVGGDLDQLGAAEHLGDHPGLRQGKLRCREWRSRSATGARAQPLRRGVAAR